MIPSELIPSVVAVLPMGIGGFQCPNGANITTDSFQVIPIPTHISSPNKLQITDSFILGRNQCSYTVNNYNHNNDIRQVYNDKLRYNITHYRKNRTKYPEQINIRGNLVLLFYCLFTTLVYARHYLSSIMFLGLLICSINFLSLPKDYRILPNTSIVYLNAS